MGKSTAARLLAGRGYPVADTDLIAREVVEPGTAALREVAEIFGSAMLTSEGRLDRERMGALVFTDPEARRRLEAILHPRIREAWGRRVDEWRAGGARLGVVVIPLLFETGAEALFDAVVCVACSRATQALRLAGRGWSPVHAAERVASQMPIEVKIQRSRYVVWTDVPVAVHEEQLGRVVDRVAA